MELRSLQSLLLLLSHTLFISTSLSLGRFFYLSELKNIRCLYCVYTIAFMGFLHFAGRLSPFN